MVAVGARDPAVRTEVLTRFRAQADRGFTGPEDHRSHRDGWAFAHYPTIHGVHAPDGFTPRGETDSERYFLQVLDEYHRMDDMEAAIRNAAPRVAALRNSSTTFLLTDGARLFAFRGVGTEVGSCGTRSCQLEHYTMGLARWNGADVLLQEPQLLPGLTHWRELPVGSMLALGGLGNARIVPVLTGASSRDATVPRAHGDRPPQRVK